MQTTQLRKIVLTSLALIGFIATPLWAASQKSVNENFATVQSYGNSVSWSIHPSVRFDSITVNLSPTEGSQTVIVSASEPSTGALVDGGYNYELVVSPSLGPSVRAELKAARKAAGGQEAKATVKALKSQGKIPQHRQVQSGYFTILNGQLVSADAEE